MAFNFFQYWVYDILFLIVFCLGVVLFLYKRRKNLKREGLMYLYRTRVGIRFIDYIGTKYKKTLNVIAYLAIISGYLLMISMIFILFKTVQIYLSRPDIVNKISIMPVMPLVPYIDTIFKVDFLPPFYFTYWIIAIAVIAIFHEFAHGIIARNYGVRIKSTGFGFLGPFLAAFVDPDEKQMPKKTKTQQIAILSAGTFANVLLAIFFIILLSLFFWVSYAPSGAIVGGYIAAPVKVSSITSLGGIAMINTTKLDIANTIDTKNLTNNLYLEISGKNESFTKIIADNKTYYMNKELLKEQLNQTNEQVILFPNYPAIESKMIIGEVIVKMDEVKIKDYKDLAEFLNNTKPEQIVKIITKNNNQTKEYWIQLQKHPIMPDKGVMGIIFSDNLDSRLISKMDNMFTFFKKPYTSYEPRFTPQLIIFIYNLIWWLIVINISVALMNMLPVGIFDGGRMFMLTIWGVTRSKRTGEILFKIFTYIILICFALLMVGWWFARYMN